MSALPGDAATRRFGDLTVRIDRTACIGSGSCTRVAPDVFALDADRVVTFLDDAPSDPDRSRLVEACRSCPVDALSSSDRPPHP